MTFDIDELPDDPEEMFLYLERRFRRECEDDLDQLSLDDERVTGICLRYMRKTLAAASECGIAAIEKYEVPLADEFEIGHYRDFIGAVDQCRTGIDIRHARRAKAYSVRFDPNTKSKISHFISQLRDLFQKLEVDDRKREALLSRLEDLQKEVDKDRTRFEVFAALVVETAGVIGDAAEQLEPVRKLVDSIAGLIWGSKQAEQTKLPSPSQPKRLPQPEQKPRRMKAGGGD